MRLSCLGSYVVYLERINVCRAAISEVHAIKSDSMAEIAHKSEEQGSVSWTHYHLRSRSYCASYSYNCIRCNGAYDPQHRKEFYVRDYTGHHMREAMS